MKNFNHDIVHQLSEDLDSLWRYKIYMRNAKNCKGCIVLWKKFQKIDGEKVGILQKEICKHVKAGKFL